MKKFIQKSLAVVLTLCMLCEVAGATGSIKDSIKDKHTAATEVNNFLDDYLQYDAQGKNRGIYSNADGIDLHDIEGNIIAYMLPLFDENGRETGYIVTSSVENGRIMLELSLDSATVSEY